MMLTDMYGEDHKAMAEKQLPAWVSGVCFLLVFVIVYTAIAFGIGHSVGLSEAQTKAALPIIRQGELPYNVPVLVIKVLNDGRVTAESAIRTDYAGVLPFSTTGHSIPFDQLESWDYWTELSAVLSVVNP